MSLWKVIKSTLIHGSRARLLCVLTGCGCETFPIDSHVSRPTIKRTKNGRLAIATCCWDWGFTALQSAINCHQAVIICNRLLFRMIEYLGTG